MTGQEEAQYKKMTETPIPKLIVKLAVPTIISMLITSIYNMADTFFVSQLGTSATGAVGIVFSIMAIIQAVGFMMGMGAGSQLSRLLGQKKNKEASEVGATGFYCAFAFGICLTVFGLIFLDPLMSLLGATPTILPYARGYASYILIGASIMCASFVLNNILRGEGKATLAMVGIATGGIIFVIVFHLGVAGVALATVLAQFISAVVCVIYVFMKLPMLRFVRKEFHADRQIVREIVRIGVPSALSSCGVSISVMFMQRAINGYGSTVIAAYTIGNRGEQVGMCRPAFTAFFRGCGCY